MVSGGTEGGWSQGKVDGISSWRLSRGFLMPHASCLGQGQRPIQGAEGNQRRWLIMADKEADYGRGGRRGSLGGNFGDKVDFELDGISGDGRTLKTLLV